MTLKEELAAIRVKRMKLKEELAAIRAKINQGQAIYESKLNQGTQDGGFTFHAHISDHHENTERKRAYIYYIYML